MDSTLLIALIGGVSAALSSPAVTALVNLFTGRKNLSKRIDDVAKRQDDSELYEAIKDMKRANWRIFSKRTLSYYDIAEWIMLEKDLTALLPVSEWDENLQEDTRRARLILNEYKSTINKGE